MHHLPLDHDVRARKADALTLESKLREDEVRRRRADVDSDRPQAQPLRRDVRSLVIRVMPVMTVMTRPMGMR
jgi:hypothetical protein